MVNFRPPIDQATPHYMYHGLLILHGQKARVIHLML